jgi:hypothetical protein
VCADGRANQMPALVDGGRTNQRKTATCGRTTSRRITMSGAPHGRANRAGTPQHGVFPSAPPVLTRARDHLVTHGGSLLSFRARWFAASRSRLSSGGASARPVSSPGCFSKALILSMGRQRSRSQATKTRNHEKDFEGFVFSDSWLSFHAAAALPRPTQIEEHAECFGNFSATSACSAFPRDHALVRTADAPARGRRARDGRSRPRRSGRARRRRGTPCRRRAWPPRRG